MKRKILFVTALFVASFAGATLAGCGGTSWEVSSAENLFDDGAGITSYVVPTIDKIRKRTVTVQNDIDCQMTGGLIYGKTFDGQDHVISNALLSNALFDEQMEEIKNVTFDNVVVNVQYGRDVGIIQNIRRTYTYTNTGTKLGAVIGEPHTYENVHIKNSKLIVTGDASHMVSVGGFIGNSYCDSFKNCSIENCEITVTGYTGHNGNAWKMNSANLNVGGFLGYAEDVVMENCRITGCTVTVTAGGGYDDPYVGGMFGSLTGDSKIKTSYSSTNTMNINSNWSKAGNYLNDYASETLPIVAGGVFGTSGNGASFYACHSTGNDLVLSAKGSYYVGGFGALCGSTCTECYSAENTLNVSGRDSEDQSTEVTRNFGGFAARTSGANCDGCFSYANFNRDTGRAELLASEGRTGGFVGISGKEQSAIKNCVSIGYDPEPQCGKKDAFANFSAGIEAEKCYSDGDCSTSGCTVKSVAELFEGEGLKALCRLSDPNWKYTAGEIPRLLFA